MDEIVEVRKYTIKDLYNELWEYYADDEPIDETEIVEELLTNYPKYEKEILAIYSKRTGNDYYYKDTKLKMKTYNNIIYSIETDLIDYEREKGKFLIYPPERIPILPKYCDKSIILLEHLEQKLEPDWYQTLQFYTQEELDAKFYGAVNKAKKVIEKCYYWND